MNEKVLCLPARISAERAVAFFDRPRLTNLYGLWSEPARIAKPGDPNSRVPPFVECLWMPAYAVRLKTAVKLTTATLWMSVDAWSGEVNRFEGYPDLALCEWDDRFFSPKLCEEHAGGAAREGLIKMIFRQRGQFNKPMIEAVEKVVLYHYPFWVLYYRRLRKRLDIRVLDALSGQSAGPKARVNILDALIASHAKPAS